MARTKLCPHWIPRHTDGMDVPLVAKWDPRCIKVVDPDPSFVRELMKRTNAVIVLRDHPLSEQHDDMMRDPAGTGTRHAQRWLRYITSNGFRGDTSRMLFEGINEPRVWDPGVDDALNVYTVSFLDELSRFGLLGVALNFSVGWPRNDGPDMPPRWDLYEPVHDAIKRGNHVLGLHEYWSHNGVEQGWGWFAGRYTKCPWDVPILIGECGLDEAVIGEPNFDKRGWKAWLNKERYMAQLSEYDRRIALDPRIIGATIFTHDYSGPEWKTFDTRDGLREELAEYGANAVLPDPNPSQPIARGVVTAEYLNVRPSPGLSGKPIDMLRKGTVVSIYADAEGDGYRWYNIGANRWVAAQYVQIGTEPAPPSDVPEVGTVLWPVAGSSVITQQWLQHPEWYESTYNIRGHNGIDIASDEGTAVVSIKDGVVVDVGYDEAGYGHYVRVWHPGVNYLGNTIHTFYAHLSKVNVKKGDKLNRGDVVGRMGSTGRSSGPHLHFEVRLADAEGNYVAATPNLGKGRIDPYRFLLEHGVISAVDQISVAV